MIAGYAGQESNGQIPEVSAKAINTGFFPGSLKNSNPSSSQHHNLGIDAPIAELLAFSRSIHQEYLMYRPLGIHVSIPL